MEMKWCSGEMSNKLAWHIWNNAKIEDCVPENHTIMQDGIAKEVANEMVQI